MKVEAYRCDYCGDIKPYDAITGVYPIADMFEHIKDFPVCPNPVKTNVHFCTDCYNRVVMEKARLIDRRKNEREYELKLKELSYALRSTCVKNVQHNKHF